jgi:hypothetical protein
MLEVNPSAYIEFLSQFNSCRYSEALQLTENKTLPIAFSKELVCTED